MIAAVLTATVAGTMAYEGVYPVAVLLGAAAFGFTRRSIPVQIAARASAYIVGVPLALTSIDRLASGAPLSAAYVAASLALGAALALARPMLNTAEARSSFDPARFRGLFLAGATAMTSAAIAAGAYAAVGFALHSALQLGFNAALAVVFLVAVRALLSMRTWGLLLGAVTSLALLALVPFFGAMNAITLSLAAMPALLLWAVPLLLASRPRLRVEVPATMPRIEETHVRVSEHEEEEELLESADLRRRLIER